MVRLADGATNPLRGTVLEVRGPLADPYGQLEVRPAATGLTVRGVAALPSPAAVDAATLGEASEGRVVVATGIVESRPSRAISGDISLDLRGTSGTVRLFADGSSGLTADSFAVGATYDIVGIAGQRASRKGVPDGYRIWVRDQRDIHRRDGSTTPPTPTPRPTSASTPTPAPGSSSAPITTVSIAEAIRAGHGIRRVEGIVTVAPTLLDATGRRILIEDRTAGIEVLVPHDVRVPALGSRIRVDGEIGRAWDAPRLKATRIDVLAVGIKSVPTAISSPPTAALEWRLVQVAGTVAEVHKLGDRWRAELTVGTQHVVVTGLAGARIPVTTLAVGRRASVVGFVRRPYPGATDRRWAVVPRNQADIVVSASAGSSSGSSGASGESTGGAGSAGHDPSSPRPSGSAGSAGTAHPLAADLDIVSLSEHVGETVRIGGLISEVTTDGFLLDDGTAIGRVRLAGSATEYVTLLEAGDAVNATGSVTAEGGGFVLVVADAAGLVRAGDPNGNSDGSVTDATQNDPAAGDAAQPSASDGPGGPGQLAGGFLPAALTGEAGLVGLAFASVVSVGVTAARRERSRRRLARRMAARLATFGGPPGGRA